MDHFQSLNQNLNTSNYPGDDHQEESGWTAYFEDFTIYINNSNNSGGYEDGQSFSSSTEICSPSIVSDAASFPAWKSSQPNKHQHLVIDKYSSLRRLKLRKTRTNEIISHDNSLEDTASSPVNSPKLSNFGAGEINPAGRAGYDHFSISSLGKGSSLGHGNGRKEAEKRHEMHYSGKIINDPMELKKRGLCLVPVSMLFNYVG